MEDAVLAVKEDGQLLLVVVRLPGGLVEGIVPLVEGLYGNIRRVLKVEGVYDDPVRGVPGVFQGIDYNPVDE